MPRPVYWHIPSADAAADARFFEQLFGWQLTPSEDNYWMFDIEGGLSGGIMPGAEPPGHGITVYIKVDDISAALARVVELGGEILRPKTAIGGDWGFWAEFSTPGGCRSVALWSKD
ncbi:MAG: VOC family protein [bacterium]